MPPETKLQITVLLIQMAKEKLEKLYEDKNIENPKEILKQIEDLQLSIINLKLL